MKIRALPHGYVPLRGDKFGQLTATGKSELWKQPSGKQQRYSEVRCCHGNINWVFNGHLNGGHTASCRMWPECSSRPKEGDKFGSLTVTGKSEGRFSEVICEHHNKNWVDIASLKNGRATSCQRWVVCFPKKGEKFGCLVTTGTYKKIEWLCAEVRCKHGSINWVRVSRLKRRLTISCRNWLECQLTRGQRNHRYYIRRHTPAVNLSDLSKQQGGVCVVCGNILRQDSLNSIEHLIPVICFARSKKWSLKEKNARANSLNNLFASHHSCNTSKSGHSLRDYWKKHPEFEKPSRVAIARARRARKDVQLLKAA